MQQSSAGDYQKLKELLADQRWRLSNLYHIRDVRGNRIRFTPNWAQTDFMDNLHYFNVVLKARQLGFSTFIIIYMLDAALFNSNHRCGIIDAGIDDAKKKLKTVKFAYDNLPEWLRAEIPMTVRAAETVEFGNGSGISVGTSHRGDTLQKLHVSEYGKIAARYPEKAREIKTGALNTVHAGQQIFVESTAEGQQGEFYELVQLSRRLQDEGKPLSTMDPKFHFYPWYKCPTYELSGADAANTLVTIQDIEYFQRLGVDLLPGQKAWYVKKASIMGDDMKREFPATPEESFEASTEGAIYEKQMRLVRANKQIGYVPHEPSKRVFTFWDLGKGSDYTSIWFFQHIGDKYRFIDYHESHNEGWEYYAKLLASKPYVYEDHYLPHDANTAIAGRVISTTKQELHELGVRPIKVVPRTNDLWSDIKGQCRSTLPRCWFDETKCAVGIKHLDNYRREWDDKLAVWRDRPRHDDASHGSDAWRTFAIGYKGRSQEFIDNYAPQQFADMDYDLYSV